MIRTIIIDDEQQARSALKYEIGLHCPDIQLIAEATSVSEGVDILSKEKPELVFLDIRLSDGFGFDILERSEVPGLKVIITSAYSEYALKGYELNVTDYLLKPFSFERFLQAVDKIQDSKLVNHKELNSKFIFIKTESRLEKVNIDEILFIEGMRDYRRIHTINKRIMTLQNFSELEQLLPANLICRVHKSYMVAISKIDEIERSRIKISKEIIPISETYRDHFFSQIKS